MTSPATDAETKKHFRDHGFFGLKESQVGCRSWRPLGSWAVVQAAVRGGSEVGPGHRSARARVGGYWGQKQ